MRVVVSTLDGVASTELEVDAESTFSGLKDLCSKQWRFPAQLLTFKVGDAEPSDASHLSSLCAAGASELAVSLALSLSVLESEDVQLRDAAQQALDEVDAQEVASPEVMERALQALRPALADAMATYRRQAVLLLAKVAAPGDQQVVDLACTALEDHEPAVAIAATDVLGSHAKPGDAKAIDAVIAALHKAPAAADGDITFSAASSMGGVPEAAVRTLGSLATKGDERCVEALCHAMKDANGYLKMQVIDVVGIVAQPGNKIALSALQENLQHKSDNIRLKALEIFIQLAPAGDASAIEAFTQCLQDDKARIRSRALIALSKFVAKGESDVAVSAICFAVSDKEADVRCVALEVLPELAAKGDALALVAIRSRLEPEEDEDPDVVQAAKDALEALGA